MPPAARRFWNWVKDVSDDSRTLTIDGVIAEETWWGDEVTPKLFKSELTAGSGAITVWINSPGGDCVAASRIYSMLMDYTGDVTVKIDGIAASAASVIAMAGTKIFMAPTALMMVHNPLTVAIGDSEEMQKAIAMLGEVKESIINAYEFKTGMGRTKLSNLMDAETWMNAHKAVELGFADGLLQPDSPVLDNKRSKSVENYAFSRRAVTASLLDKITQSTFAVSAALPSSRRNVRQPDKPTGVPAESLQKRLNLILH